LLSGIEDVDARHKAGHDDMDIPAMITANAKEFP
jgi:hypothetical protein